MTLCGKTEISVYEALCPFGFRLIICIWVKEQWGKHSVAVHCVAWAICFLPQASWKPSSMYCVCFRNCQVQDFPGQKTACSWISASSVGHRWFMIIRSSSLYVWHRREIGLQLLGLARGLPCSDCQRYCRATVLTAPHLNLRPPPPGYCSRGQ